MLKIDLNALCQISTFHTDTILSCSRAQNFLNIFPFITIKVVKLKISEEIKLLSANGKDKKCYPTMPGLYGWSVYFEIVIEIEKNLLFQHSSELVYFTRLYLPLFAIFKLTVFGLNIGLKSSFMVTQFPQK